MHYVCPTHRLRLYEENSRLSCPEGHSFPVVAGIPRFILEDTYAAAFGAQWNHYRQTQLDSYTGRPITRDRAKRCFGEAWDVLAGKSVLECGCGAGRFTEVLLNQGAKVTSVDLSSAVDANAENFPLSDRHEIAQADIMALPYAEGSFDFVLCVGVVQHTPNTEKAIAELYRVVKPGGLLVIDHYTFELSLLTKSSWLFRAVLKRLPPEKGIRATERLVKTLLPMHKAVRNHFPLQALLSRVSPVRCYYRTYDLTDELHYQWALLDTHDSLTDWHKRLRTKGQIRRTLERLGAVEIHSEYGGNGVEARCRKPNE